MQNIIKNQLTLPHTSSLSNLVKTTKRISPLTFEAIWLLGKDKGTFAFYTGSDLPTYYGNTNDNSVLHILADMEQVPLIHNLILNYQSQRPHAKHLKIVLELLLDPKSRTKFTNLCYLIDAPISPLSLQTYRNMKQGI